MGTDKNELKKVDPLLLFDGECGLCNAVVRAFLRLDRRGRLRFGRLQGVTGQAALRRLGLPTEEFESLVFLPDGPEGTRAFLKSDGALEALRTIGGIARGVAAVGRCVPRAWRDGLYGLVGRWRYRMFGVYQPRPLAKAEWARRFME